MFKIDENKIQQYGTRGFSLAVPKVFITDNNLDKGDSLNVYRTFVQGKDALIITPAVLKPEKEVA